VIAPRDAPTTADFELPGSRAEPLPKGSNVLSRDDNEMICRVGAGTPGGELMRQYWLPAALSSELPGPDCAPLRVRLLGEDLVAFRDSSGQVGLVGAHCPHRGASLFFGRNEENGLRCVYHGWKFDRQGHCMDMPNAPGLKLKDSLRHKAYPCVERAHVVWTYMGPLDPPPPLPQIPCMDLPDDQVVTYKHYQAQNWLQGIEGSIDPSHGAFLHSDIDPQTRESTAAVVLKNSDQYFQTSEWTYDIADLGHAAMIADWRPVDDVTNYWRVNTFFLPCYADAPIASGPDPAGFFFIYVPIDDEHCFHYAFTWHNMRPLSAAEHNFAEFAFKAEFAPGDPALPGSEWLQVNNASNDYGLDREVQRHTSFSGIPIGVIQDQAITESMGPIYDRTQEHLVPSDKGIVLARSIFLRAAKALRDHGTTPPGVQTPEAYRIRAPDKYLPIAETNWREALRDFYTFRPGYNPPLP
jgi:nitrite reductase/ring-hydroxylating ferredoxin subunit